MLLDLLICRGGLVFVIPMTWFEGELVFYLVYLYPFASLLHFLHTHRSYLASLVIQLVFG
jgi:hypothetical protein